MLDSGNKVNSAMLRANPQTQRSARTMAKILVGRRKVCSDSCVDKTLMEQALCLLTSDEVRIRG